MYLPLLKRQLLRLFSALGALSIALSLPANATTVANCNTNLTLCLIPQDVLLELPFTAIAGDAVLLASNETTPVEAFRIFNNVINTGAGTGLGNLAELFNADHLPLPTVYSANAVFLPEDPSGVTTYSSAGTTYILGAPEPRSLALLSFAAALLLLPRARSTITFVRGL